MVGARIEPLYFNRCASLPTSDNISDFVLTFLARPLLSPGGMHNRREHSAIAHCLSTQPHANPCLLNETTSPSPRRPIVSQSAPDTARPRPHNDFEEIIADLLARCRQGDRVA